jgi:ATP-dependent helicase/nuclease subunit A
MAKRTREQNLALMTDRYVAVTANAGSGKTRVLVERYLELITKPDINGNLFEIEEIAAITFTKKAASEMKAKIIRILNDKIKEYDSDLKKSLFYDDIRDNMIYANISTIHSFCYQILKEYPIEAEIPPNFGELTDYDYYNIIDDSIDEILEKFLEKDNKSKNEFLFNLVQIMDYNNLRNNLKNLLSSGESYNNFINFYSNKTIQELSQNYNLIIFEYIKRNLINYVSNLLNYIEAIYEGNEKNIDKIVLAQNSIKDNLTSIEKEKSNIYNLIQYYYKTIKAVKVKAGKSYILTQIIKIIDDYDFSIAEKNITSIAEIYSKYSLEIINDIQNEYLKTILLFRDTAIEIHDLIERSKIKIPAFTFDDILLKTLELLKKNNNDIREKIRRKLKYLLVDEFQDTNLVQYNIIKYLIPDFDNSHQYINQICLSSEMTNKAFIRFVQLM